MSDGDPKAYTNSLRLTASVNIQNTSDSEMW